MERGINFAVTGPSVPRVRRAPLPDDAILVIRGDDLERFSLLGCYRVVDLQKAGFEIWPTFRTPHVTIAFTSDLDERLAALAGVAHEVRVNPYHESDDTSVR